MSVPDYDYSINPLEGWLLQPFENTSELSWYSSNQSIALSVLAFSGETYSDITTMFNDLTKEYDASGSFVKFQYLGFECTIGEITFKLGGETNKGWILFLNGSNFDYQISSFSRIESYEDNINEIQSVIDSFSPGKKGAINSGPISMFLNESPSKIIKNFPVDFFGNTLIVSGSEYDFENAQSIIEREANIMQNYSHDRKNFYNAWKRYYKVIFRDNYSRLEPLFVALYPYFADNKYTDYNLVELLMFWIQGYTYERSLESESDLLNPFEASTLKLGDCDTRSLILGILLNKFGVENILLTSEKVKHAIIAVDCPGDGMTYEYKGKKYLMVELTTKALIGEIKESFADPALWTPVEMEYLNGF